jgi:hypothetical protein
MGKTLDFESGTSGLVPVHLTSELPFHPLDNGNKISSLSVFYRFLRGSDEHYKYVVLI